MAQADIDLAALTVAANRMAKLLGMPNTQAMSTLADPTGVTAALVPLLTFGNTVTLTGSQAQKADANK